METRPDPQNQPRKTDHPYNTTEPDVTPRREGGDDAMAESSPQDTRADEKVIANDQRENNSINNPIYQPASYAREMEENY